MKLKMEKSYGKIHYLMNLHEMFDKIEINVIYSRNKEKIIQRHAHTKLNGKTVLHNTAASHIFNAQR